MGQRFQHVLGIQRLAYFGGVVFAVIIVLLHFEFPYGDVISSSFYASKIHISYGAYSNVSNCSTYNSTTALKAPQILLDSNIPETYKNASILVHNFTKNESIARNIFPSANLSAVTEVHRKKQKVKVVSVSEMHDILVQNRASSHSKKPLWTSRADQDLLNAKIQFENTSYNEDDHSLYPSVFRNISIFRRSYELMEKTFKVYIYKEGEKPIFHQPEAVMKGIYASEGWFMMQMKSSKRFITKKPKQAHLFYIPYSSKLLKETLFPNSYDRESVVPYLKNYIDLISGRYSFWNRTGGADHFLVACHDWAPDETRRFMDTCIRAICNTDIQKSSFELGKDVSLPETNIRYPQNPLQNLGGKPPSKRSIFAFFAGKMHGYLRPILLRHWENKDPEMKILKKLPKVKDDKNYVDFMKNSKFCICAKGSEVNSPRVVEAIFYECVPVIISDNFVPPFFEVLDWESFAVFIPEKDIPDLKKILLSIPKNRYLQMHQRVKEVQKHFLWHVKPVRYDIFHMILHSIWYTRLVRVKSYEIMEQTLKVYIYKDGEKPIFHDWILEGIYASEGWFLKLMEANKQFVTEDPSEAHLFYIPFSSRLLELTLYVPHSHSRDNLIQFMKNHTDMLITKYPFWNRTDGSDHFLAACHDWAPAETRVRLLNTIRALCNADIQTGFHIGKDVSLPTTYVQSATNPLKKVGGEPPSNRSTLAFFAGHMHGLVRPILLAHWGNDTDMKILPRMPHVKGNQNYIDHMKTSKFCICARGFAVHSPRVVESLYFNCVPVIISDNYVPPLFNVLNWESFAVFISEKDIPNLKAVLLSITEDKYVEMYERVRKVKEHFFGILSLLSMICFI
ncbi:hypothetical protein E3N88_33180 [Mikania micrantha]|uniref:Exostosin GT47 domain-containing protein n=1 Tax=Mikania micrantha TaxID=192012 RepID=A0A5N6MAQ2_9ASTR|nr:hypothetical protein E3N88_33180 [Mikania micrantha]